MSCKPIGRSNVLFGYVEDYNFSANTQVESKSLNMDSNGEQPRHKYVDVSNLDRSLFNPAEIANVICRIYIQNVPSNKFKLFDSTHDPNLAELGLLYLNNYDFFFQIA